MKQLRVFLLPPGWNASPSQGYPPPALFYQYESIHLNGEQHYVKCLVQERNTMTPARSSCFYGRTIRKVMGVGGGGGGGGWGVKTTKQNKIYARQNVQKKSMQGKTQRKNARTRWAAF